jgi:hypothetical protein
LKLKRIITVYKRTKKKIRNENNKDQIRKCNTISFNWMMKLKTTKSFTKRLRKKNRNSKNEDHIEDNIW